MMNKLFMDKSGSSCKNRMDHDGNSIKIYGTLPIVAIALHQQTCLKGNMDTFCRIYRDFVTCCAMLLAVAVLSGCAGPGGRDIRHPIREVPQHHRQEVVLTALGLMGSPYRYGGSEPAQGFDCSGLVNYVYRQVTGTTLPRSTREQAAASRRISRRDLRAGDLVFFNTLGRPHSHVGIYIGEGQFVNAPSSGGRVRIDSMDNPYFSSRFDSARTVFAP